MEWILDNLQFLVIAAGTVAYWLNQRREARQAEEESSQLPPEPSLHELPPEREREERPVLLPDEVRRRILEQLGIPQEEITPPPAPPPLPVLPPPPLPEPVALVAPAKPKTVLKPLAITRRPARHTALRAALRSKPRVREAFVLRELLGTPTGLQSGRQPVL